MIDYAAHILKKLTVAATEAFSEIVYADGKELSDDVATIALQANNALPSGLVMRDSPVAAFAQTIEQATFVASVIERLLPKDAFRRAMAQVAVQLSNDISTLTDPERREQYADCSVFIEDDPFNVAVILAATHIVASAARNFTTVNCEALAAFVSAELAEGNAFMLSDLNAIRAAARECGVTDTADNATA